MPVVRSRLVSSVAVFAVSAAALFVACGLTADFSNLQNGYCESPPATRVFCADFDQQPLPFPFPSAGWHEFSGNLTLDNSDSVSPPNSAYEQGAPDMPGVDSTLRVTFPRFPPLPSTLAFEFWIKHVSHNCPNGGCPVGGDRLVVASLDFLDLPDGAPMPNRYSVQFTFVYDAANALSLALEEQSDTPGTCPSLSSTSEYAVHPIPSAITAAEWKDVRLTVRLGAGLDAGADAGPDGGPDAGSDAGPDAASDTGPDAGSDASLDAGPAAGRDAGDAAPDTGSDASPGCWSSLCADVKFGGLKVLETPLCMNFVPTQVAIGIGSIYKGANDTAQSDVGVVWNNRYDNVTLDIAPGQ
jgi:hypothetical protein